MLPKLILQFERPLPVFRQRIIPRQVDSLMLPKHFFNDSLTTVKEVLRNRYGSVKGALNK